MKTLLWTILILGFVCSVNSSGLLTESMKKGIKRIGENCQKSVNATIEEMNQIRHGPPYTGKTACAVACILEKGGVMADKKFSKKGMMTAVAPFILADPKKLGRMREIANDCEQEASGTMNECEGANSIIECLRKNIPQITDFDF